MDRRSFTLIEIVVVLVILSVAATLIVPRMAGSADRQAHAEALAVQSLLSTAAQLHTHPGSAQSRDGANGAAWVILYRDQTQQLTFARAVPGERKGETAYEPDRLAESVPFIRTFIAQLIVDGREFPASSTADWQISFDPDLPIPAVSILLRTSETGRSWQIDLMSETAEAQLRELAPDDKFLRPIQGRSIDLDTSSRGETAW